jgi:dTDP-4-dehydrorhamnose 3,5-epimerase
VGIAMSEPGYEAGTARAEPALPEGVRLSPLRRIDTPAGPVLHALKASEPAFQGFGEAYFTTVRRGQVKAWKRHRRMVSNLVVPVGEVRLQLLDDRPDSSTRGLWLDLRLGLANYQRLTVPPGVWFGFEGRGEGLNLMMNLASIEHDPTETDTLPLDDPRFAQSGW